jgi:hypothetical protein
VLKAATALSTMRPTAKYHCWLATSVLYGWLVTYAFAFNNTTSRCTSRFFDIPQLPGATIIAIEASKVDNFTEFSLSPGSSRSGIYCIQFCNVTITYTHPGWNDNIHVQVWLPFQDWNGRLQALGGGGYSASFGSLYLTQAVAEGYVAIDTDAGHGSGMVNALSPAEWALTSPGNVNLYLLEDFASRSLKDMAVVGKAITKAYYGVGPKFSYFSGCSGGGRQGLMIAQRYPDAYDGILAVAPAINLQRFIPAAYWASQVMKTLEVFPPPCEIEAFTRAAVANCDTLDGVKDGIIGRPDLCNFTAHSIVGQQFSCNGTTKRFTEAGADIVHAAWTGPRDPSGSSGWFGLNKDASLTSTYVMTACSSNQTCTPSQTTLLTDWFRYFLAKDPKFNASAMTNEEFFSYLKLSETEYHSILSSADPDLAGFHASGGKMIAWHGMSDETIPPAGSVAYFEQVLRNNPKAEGFFRFFEAPGVGHCIGGPGHIPTEPFEQLVAWVENNIPPDELRAATSSGLTRSLCPYPSRQLYVGGDPKLNTSFTCTKEPGSGRLSSLVNVQPFYQN